MITNSKPELQVDQRPWYDRHTWGSCRDGRDPELCAWCEANPPNSQPDKHKRVAERLIKTDEEYEYDSGFTRQDMYEIILREEYPE